MRADADKTSGELTLRIPNRSLGEFISGLLGQKRTIRHRFEERPFLAEQNWILNILEVVDQRLSQNPHSLASFKASIYFSGGVVHSMESVDAFKAYSNMSNEETVGLSLSISYVVSFPDKEFPEKQSIEVNIFSDGRFFYEANPSEGEKRRANFVEYSVDFTNLTFGEDLARHISTYIEKIFVKDDVLSKLTRLIQTRIFNFMISLVGMTLVFYGDLPKYMYIKLANSALTKYNSISDADPFTTIEHKLDYFFDAWLQRTPKIDISMIIGFVLMTLGMALAIFNTAKRFQLLRRSFLIFNDHTSRLANSYVTNRVYVKWTVYVGGTISIVASILATHLDKAVWNWLGFGS